MNSNIPIEKLKIGKLYKVHSPVTGLERYRVWLGNGCFSKGTAFPEHKDHSCYTIESIFNYELCVVLSKRAVPFKKSLSYVNNFFAGSDLGQTVVKKSAKPIRYLNRV